MSESTLVVSLVGGSHFVNHMYFMLLPPIFAALRRDLGVGDPALGLALGVLGFVVTALQLPFGHVSDTYSRTAVLAVSLVFGAVGAVLTATAQSYAWLLGAQVILGIGVAGHHPAHYPLLSSATDPDVRGRAYSVHGFTGALGFAAPPAIVAVGTTLGVGWRTSLGFIAIVGALYAVVCLAAFARYVCRDVTHPTAAQVAAESSNASESPLARILSVLGGVVTSRPLLLLTALWFATSMASWGVRQYTATLLTGGYGLPVTDANLVVSSMLALGAVLIFGGGWLADRLSSGTVLFAGYGALVVVAGTLAWGGLPVVAAIALTLVLSTTVDSSRPARAKLADSLSAEDSVGKNFGLLTIGISGGGAVAPPVLAVVVERWGVAPAFGIIAAVGVLALVLTAVVVAAERETSQSVTPTGE
ncbi:MFS transporter [Haloarculaceae archaeon H-GB2-1]|nr:MFS transporter [Haloarculaceae archaeon H-GB1-1]MEA5386119.1 MFS transporter [Haloarculaceae archaeon H-GB11]MEA5407626.1 MFS transporter [Haloarculaceae archaeon H-GB2-1]